MNYQFQDKGERQATLRKLHRLVVKVGSNLVRENPARRTRELVRQLAGLRERGIEVILVTSGAIPLGMSILERAARPKDMAKVQAMAALGQCYLMRHYENACEEHGFHCAQLLLTAADLQNRDRNLHVTACLRALLDEGVLPVINENDSVSVEQIKIGDNDTLAAMLATMLDADLTVLLTTIDGFHESGVDGTLGQRISVIRELDDRLLAMAGSTDGNPYSTGGMITKLHAASICTTGGHALAIVDGHDFTELERFLNGEDCGTLFLQPNLLHPMRSWQRFLAFFSEPAGTLILDAGAADAVTNRNKSLLPGGILGSNGTFRKGDTVRLVGPERTEIARGVVNFSYEELARICGAKTTELAARLGHPVENTEVVHKDYLVIIK
ncbi:MAG: glutamate 5-kinase [Victivallales bacterium]|nr:glutamate 5-kinase [Victivallales bacterium]